MPSLNAIVKPAARPRPKPRASRRAVVIRHLAFENLGVFAEPIKNAGYRIDYVDAGVDDLCAAAGQADLLFVLGGPISANDEADYPFLTVEIALLAGRIATDRPTVGSCLRAQLVARAAGARVLSGTTEIGVAPIALTEAGLAGPLAAFDLPAAMHWHGDGCELPPGAVLLASSAHCATQAFSLGKRVIAFQFHPELDQRRFERWLIGHAAELAALGRPVAALRQQVAAFGTELDHNGRETLDAWLERVAPRARRALHARDERHTTATTDAIAHTTIGDRPIVQFMLTRDGVVVPGALRRYRVLSARISAPAIPWIGFSHLGLSDAELEELGYALHDDGRKVKVAIHSSASPGEKIGAAELAKRVGATCLIGGSNVKAVLHAIARSPLRYFPSIGCNLSEGVVAEALHYQALGADGVLLLASPPAHGFRTEECLKAVRAATDLDIILSEPDAALARSAAASDVWALTSSAHPQA